MTEVIHERSPRSRGRVRCEECGRRVPEWEQRISLMEFDDGTVREWLRCQPCEAAAGYVARWRGPYSSDLYPDDFHEWAQEAMRHTPADDYLFLYADVGGWTHYLEDLADSAAACAAADADRAQAWDDEAWAAFTWRMQTSSVINARRK